MFLVDLRDSLRVLDDLTPRPPGIFMIRKFGARLVVTKKPQAGAPACEPTPPSDGPKAPGLVGRVGLYVRPS